MKITVHDWISFNTKWLKGGKIRGMRFGQMFCNEFNITDDETFYEEDHIKAVNLCCTKHVDHDTIGCNVKQEDCAKVIELKKCEKCGRELPLDTSSSVYSCTMGSGCADYSQEPR